jgi:dihydroxyacetone kinase
VDALLPFAETLARRTEEGAGTEAAWQEAAAAATSAAAATARLRPLKGRARPLAEKSLGTADPGATSLAMIFTVLGEYLARHAASPSAGQVREEAKATV